MTYNVFGGTLNLAQFNAMRLVYVCCRSSWRLGACCSLWPWWWSCHAWTVCCSYVNRRR